MIHSLPTRLIRMAAAAVLLAASRRQIADTPRGRFEIRDAGVSRIGPEGETTLVFATSYLTGSAHRWVQREATDRLGHRSLTTHPCGLVYDNQHDTVVVAMGLQGVAVGSSNGSWRPVAVGPYIATDFGLAPKVALLWTTTLPIALAFVALAVALRRLPASAGQASPAEATWATIVLILMPVAAMVTFLRLIEAWFELPSQNSTSFLIILRFLMAVLTAVPVIILGCLLWQRRRRPFSGVQAVVLAVCSALLTGLLLALFGSVPTDIIVDGDGLYPVIFRLAAIYGCLSLVVSWPTLRWWLPILVAYLGIAAAAVFTLRVWANVTLAPFQIAAGLLAALISWALWRHLGRRLSQESEPDPGSGPVAPPLLAG